MDRPLVSVVLSVYNAAALLEEAMRSILSQRLSDLELIVIDDGSVDDVKDVIDRFRDPRVRLFSDGFHRGLSARLNQGIELARGDYIARMDADDVSLPHRLERQLAFLRRHPDVAACGTQIIVEYGDGSIKHWRYPTKAAEVRAGLLFNNTLAHPTLMARREVMSDLQPAYEAWPLRAEDYEMLIRLTKDHKVVNLKSVGLKYRRVVQEKPNGSLEKSRETAQRLRERMIGCLGIQANENDLRLHHLISESLYSVTTVDLRAVVDWFSRLSLANCESGLLDENALNRLLAAKFFRLCRRLDASGKLAGAMIGDATFLSGHLQRRIFRLRLFKDNARYRLRTAIATWSKRA